MSEPTIYRSRWDVCDACEVAVIVERDDSRGVPDIDEWEPFPSCPLCGDSLTFGNADERTIRDTTWRQGMHIARQAVYNALRDAADELEEHLDSIGGWSNTAYKGSPGWLRDLATKSRETSEATR